MKIIDPHLHLFDLNKGQYHWLKSENPPFWPDKHLIAKNFTEADLLLSAPLALEGFVHIEAGFNNQQPWQEIAWLEKTCQGNFRSIAMLDITLTPNEFSEQLKHLLTFKSVVGIRHILDEQALEILQHQYCIDNLKCLAEHQLCFELQLSLLNSAAVSYLMQNIVPIDGLRFCINHAGFPPLALESDSEPISIWKNNLVQLSQFTNVYIKCSGYELFNNDYSRQFSRQDQQDIINQCIDSFGISRVMLASNFPLSIWQDSYQSTWQANSELAFSAEELEQLCYQNAFNFYRF